VALKLQQGQHGTEYIRIVHLERLKVGYKVPQKIESLTEEDSVS